MFERATKSASMKVNAMPMYRRFRSAKAINVIGGALLTIMKVLATSLAVVSRILILTLQRKEHSNPANSEFSDTHSSSRL